MTDDIKLMTDYDADTAAWYYVVKVNGEPIAFTPGFRTQEDAERVGDLWIRDNLGGVEA